MSDPHDHDHDDYLWDGSGKPDPEVERLERLLRPLRHEPRPLALGEPPANTEAARPALPVETARPLRSSRPVRRRRVVWVALVAAAAVLVLVAGGTWLALQTASTPPLARGGGDPVGPHGIDKNPPPAALAASWPVTMLAGAPSCAGEGVAPSCDRLTVGSWLETDAQSRAKLQVADIGFVDLEPRTRVRLVRTKKDEHRLELARGVLHATVTAVPRLFIVDTPAAEAIDLGCAYTLSSDERGNGRLSVRSGEVALVRGARESWVPEGASCELRAGIGPGTPYDARAGKALRDALDRFDFGSDKSTCPALDAILASATKHDALSLWHVAQRVAPGERERVLTRLIALWPPPPRVDRAALRRLDPGALELYKSALRTE